MTQKYYITTAIDYVNALPHIGHAYEKLAADILARYHRMKGCDVFFMTGADEHGTKVEKSAKQAGLSPKEFCDGMTAKFQESWRNLDISFDYYIRTTESRHYKSAQEVFRRLKEKGDIYKSSYVGLYCEGCEDFVKERDLDESGNCHNHLKPPKQLSEENYFFKLSKYKPLIKQWLLDNPEAVQPDGRRREVINQLDDPELTDFSVSRSKKSLTWGIPVPDDDGQVIYVWLDALINYITGAGFTSDEAKMEHYWPANLHLIGKDIVKFHSIYWPAFLMGADLPLPKQVYGHGFITVEGQKISKSLGNVIDPNALVSQYGADPIRYFLFSTTSFDQDGDFSKEEFIRKVNADLANNLGNLLNRTLTLLERNCDGLVPEADSEHYLREEANSLYRVIEKHMDKLEFSRAIDAILALVDQANKYMNDEKPWALFKEGKEKEGKQVLFTVLEILRRTALSLYPFIPKLANSIWQQLGYDNDLDQSGGAGKSNKDPESYFNIIPIGQKIRNLGPIFMRIEEAAKVSG